jgi:hypothetical protein
MEHTAYAAAPITLRELYYRVHNILYYGLLAFVKLQLNVNKVLFY